MRSILDYDIDIHPLPLEEQTYTALNMNYSVAGFQVFVFFPLVHQEESELKIWTLHVVMMKPAVFCVDKILLMLHGSLSVQMDAPNQNFQKIFAASIIWSMGFKICASLTKVRPTFNEQTI